MAALNPSPAENQNINISAYRVLYILLILVQYRSLNMIEINRFLYENPLIRRIYNTETLTKYINTLREVGCDIPRSSNRNDYCYELRKNPFPFFLDSEELAVADKLLTVLAQEPDEVLYNDYHNLLESLAWAVDTTTNPCDLVAASVTDPSLILFPELESRRKLLQTYRQYCLDAFTLQMRYAPEGGAQEAAVLPVDMRLEPHEVREKGKRLFLLGLDLDSQEQVRLDVDRIEWVRQLPSKNKRPMPQVTVIFSFYGRLAKSYRLYPGEKIVYQNAQELQVKVKVTEPSELVTRLMKYGDACEVVSPANVRQLMKDRISSLLESFGAAPAG